MPRHLAPFLLGCAAGCCVLLPSAQPVQAATPPAARSAAAPATKPAATQPRETLRFARMLFDGELYEDALKLYGQWAEYGSMEAQQRLGLMLEYGLGTASDPALADRWFRRAAAQAGTVGNDPASITALGWLYDYGKGGLPKDPQKALALYRRAAEAGFAPAQANLGASYAEGSEALPKDMKQAELWLGKAADQGYRRAQRQLDTLYANGEVLRPGSGRGEPVAGADAALPRAPLSASPGTAPTAGAKDGPPTPFAGLENMLRTELARIEKFYGTDNLEAANLQQGLAGVLVDRDAEEEKLLRKSAATYRKLSGAEDPDTLIVTRNLGVILTRRARFAEAEPILRNVLGILERQQPQNLPQIMASRQALAGLLSAQRRWDESEPLLRRTLDYLDRGLAQAKAQPGAVAPRVTAGDVVGALTPLGNELVLQGRYQEAEPLLLRALAIQEASAQPGGKQLNLDLPLRLNNLAVLRLQMDRPDEALPLLTRALSIADRALGDIQHTAIVATSLGGALTRLGRPVEAEAQLRRAIAIDEKNQSPQSRDLISPLLALADALQAQGRTADAAAACRRALDIAAKQLPPDDETTLQILETLGRIQLSRGELPAAAAQLRHACSARDAAQSASLRNRAAATQGKARREVSECSVAQALALQRWSAAGGNSSVENRPEALRREAFIAAQRSAQSAASDALARAAAMIADRSAGQGQVAAAYERTLAQRDAFKEALSRSYGASMTEDAEQRQYLVKSIADSEQALRSLETQLRTRASSYWDLRAPGTLSVEELQRATAPGSRELLHADEALVLWMMAPGEEHGLVFAVSRSGFAVAPMSLSGAQVDTRVRRLRTQIDPCGYGQSAADCDRAADGTQSFDRRAAWELHQALLGAPEIQRVVGAAGVNTLLIVPTDSLTTLPPSLLIATEPGRAGDDNAEGALRNEDWLVKHKAIAVLPAVSALRTLRQRVPASAAQANDAAPLFMMANPAFAPGSTASCVSGQRRSVPRAAQSYFQDAKLRSEELAKLPPLPCTAVEAEGMRKLLQAPLQDVVTGAAAREVTLRTRRDDVHRARVLAFATHGLVSGDLGLAEPGLALSPPQKGSPQEASDSGVLTASKIAQLDLTADWVVLSACNTASPDAPTAPGLSGLSRAFFHAGARSLLVSHWRVEDQATQALILGTFRQRAQDPGISKAEALRRASLAVMAGEDVIAPADEIADLKNHRAHPSAWAPFVVIGAPD